MQMTTFKAKCVIIGDSAVGKTSLISCFVDHKFPSDYLPTIGTNLYIKELVEDDIQIILTLWDIAGEKKWTLMRKLYYKGATGAFLVGDLTRPDTLTNLKEYWLKDLQKNCEDIPIVLLMNKNDLEKNINDDMVNEIAESIKAIAVYYTSAKTGTNVDQAFNTLIKKMLSNALKKQNI